MCGIVGFTEPSRDADACLRIAARMLAAVAHRGPYGATARRHAGVTLAHCALPFVAAGNGQPFVSASGRTAVVFNGEVYNYAELRAELAAAGVRLRDGGDTELFVELYEREGMGFLARLRGMYAFALYDAVRGALVLARDPFGKKPLYYRHAGGGTVFASELGALLAHPACPRTVAPAAVADYLTLQAFPAPGTALDGVRKVRPGCYLTIDAAGVRETGYAAPPLVPRHDRAGLTDRLDAFERVLRGAVARRVGSTAEPLGVLLSGGVDSSVVAALAGQVAGRPLPVFCARFTDPAFDESGHAERVARHLGAEFHPVPATAADLAETADLELRRIDEPLADPSLLPTLLVCRAARQRVRAVLTGDGADELLLGYRFFQAERVIEALTRVLPDGLLGRLGAAGAGTGPRRGNLPARAALAQLARGVRAAPERRFYESTRPFRPADLAAAFTPEAWAAVGGHRPYRELDRYLGDHSGLGPLERAQLGMVCHFLRDVILTKVDRGSMHSALEARSPFLDPDVVRFCGGLPTDLKLHGLTGKYLLRRLAARWLPRDVANRRKLGFRAPVGDLLRRELAPLLRDSLGAPALRRAGLFRPEEVRRLVEEHTAGRADHARKLWALLCFQLWYDGTLATPRPALGIPLRVTGGEHAGTTHPGAVPADVGGVRQLSRGDAAGAGTC